MNSCIIKPYFIKWYNIFSANAKYVNPTFHWTAIPLRSWRSRIFSKIIPNRRGFGDLTLPVRFHYASTTILLRCCHDPTTTMKSQLRLVYADGDVAATLLRPWRWSYAFVALLYALYLEFEIPICFYYDLGASTTLLLRSCRFCTILVLFAKISNRSGIAIQWNGG